MNPTPRSRVGVVAASYAFIAGVHTIIVTAGANDTSIPIVATAQNISGEILNSALVTVTQFGYKLDEQ